MNILAQTCTSLVNSNIDSTEQNGRERRLYLFYTDKIRIVHFFFVDFLAGDEHDFDDVISSQHEINRLRNKVQRLEAQCDHLKKLAAKQV